MTPQEYRDHHVAEVLKTLDAILVTVALVVVFASPALVIAAWRWAL